MRGCGIGEFSAFFKSANRKSAPRWRGPAMILDIDDAGAQAAFQGQTLKVARYCVRRKVDTRDAAGVDWYPASESLETMDGMPSAALGRTAADIWGG